MKVNASVGILQGIRLIFHIRMLHRFVNWDCHLSTRASLTTHDIHNLHALLQHVGQTFTGLIVRRSVTVLRVMYATRCPVCVPVAGVVQDGTEPAVKPVSITCYHITLYSKKYSSALIFAIFTTAVANFKKQLISLHFYIYVIMETKSSSS